MIFSFLAIFHVLQWTFLNFPPFSIFLAIFHVLKCVFLISRFSVSSPYSRSYSVHFSFFTFFSDFVIVQVLKWMFLVFHGFQFSCHNPCPRWTFLNFPPFSVFLAIFHVLKCVFLISNDFQFSCHIPCPTVDISKFSSFFSFPRRI